MSTESGVIYYKLSAGKSPTLVCNSENIDWTDQVCRMRVPFFGGICKVSSIVPALFTSSTKLFFETDVLALTLDGSKEH